MQNAFFSLHDPDVSTSVLEELLVCEPRITADAETLLAERRRHVLYCGPAGVGKSHCAEVVVRRLCDRQGWRAVRLPACSHFALQGLAELVAAIADRDRGVQRAWDEPTPSVAASLEVLRERERETGRPLALLLEDLPGVLERTLRGADVRQFASLLRQLQIGVVATARTAGKNRAARALLALFDTIDVPELDRARADELISRCARVMGDPATGPAAGCARTLRPILGGNPRLITTLYRIAHERAARIDDPDILAHLAAGLMARMAPSFRAQLDALSPQQGLVLTRLALAPGPMPAARLGRQCDLPTSHTTAILDVLLSRQLVVRVPGPGKRNVYALADRLLRLFVCTEARPGAHEGIASLLRFFQQAHSLAGRAHALRAMGTEFAQLWRARLAPQLGDVRAAVQILATVLGTRAEEPGNQVLLAFLRQPEGSHDVANLRATTRAQGGDAPSGPERAVAHVALAAHLLTAEGYAEAARELALALALAPNWSDLTATAFLVGLAGGQARAGSFGHGQLGESIRAVAEFFAEEPGAAERLYAAIERGGAELAPLWRAIAMVVPVTESMRDVAMAFFAALCERGPVDDELLGIACVYAFESGLFADAARYATARDGREPLDAELWPARAWLSAMSGDLAAFVAIGLQCEDADVAQPWLLSALGVAACAASDPDEIADAMAQLIRARPRSASEMAALYGGLLLVRGRVSTDWLAAVSAALAERIEYDPQPFRAFRQFVAQRADERMLRTLHPEIREAVDYLRV